MRIYLCLYRLFSKKIIVHYLHIAKTGGTAIQNTLRPVAGKPFVNGKYILFIHSHEFTLKDVKKGEKVIFFVRDPATRFVSRYYQRKKSVTKASWSNFDRHIYETYETANEFIEALSELSEEVHSFKALTNVFNRWLGSPSFVEQKIQDGTITFVGEQEHMIEDFDLLKKKFLLPKTLVLPPLSDVKKSNTMPSSFDTRLSDTSMVIVKDYFKDEYEIINILRNYKLIRS